MDNNQKLTKIYIYYVFIYDEPVASMGPKNPEPYPSGWPILHIYGTQS